MKTKTALKLNVCVLINDFYKHLNILKLYIIKDASFSFFTKQSILINTEVAKSKISKITYYKNILIN
ncbi:hypothetical protein HNQ90_003362 [Algibacter amylolyticus]|nr:hypothetical protein [Algibacter amylolyticus]